MFKPRALPTQNWKKKNQNYYRQLYISLNFLCLDNLIIRVSSILQYRGYDYMCVFASLIFSVCSFLPHWGYQFMFAFGDLIIGVYSNLSSWGSQAFCWTVSLTASQRLLQHWLLHEWVRLATELTLQPALPNGE